MTTRRILLALAAALLAVSCSSAAVTTTSSSSDGDDGTAVTTSAPPTTLPASTTLEGVDPTPTSSTVPLSDLRLVATEVAAGLDAPVFLHADPDGGPDLVVEQPGRIRRLDRDRTVVLDIRNDVAYGGERGLLGLAFHPGYTENRLAFVNYTDRAGRTVIERFEVAASGMFGLDSRSPILVIDQPAGNHNGGMIAFGPEGYLWVGMGDGGGSNDRYRNGQRADTLLGSMLRIEVGPDIDTYRNPPTNPGGDFAPEVWWIGLRNPWRFSFDTTDAWSNVYVADVGQGDIEEVTVAPATDRRLNFGWPIMEGSSCFQTSDCDAAGLALPQIEYRHAEGCSITGGYVYRGSAIPELDGHYFFSDYCSGFLRSWPFSGEVIDWTDQVGSLGNVSSFGVGGDGELYIVALSGRIFRLERGS